MAVTINSRHDTDIMFREQAVWGTAEAAGAAFNIMDVTSSVIDPDLKERLADRSNSGVRVLQDSNVQYDTKGSSPKITIQGDAKKYDLADMLYAVTQNVSEAATTPFLKTYTLGATQPDFTMSAGYFMTLVEKQATASTSKEIHDVICTDLTLKCSAGSGLDRLQTTAVLPGRGSVTETFNPTGSNVRRAQAFYYFQDIVTFSGNGQALNPMDIEIKISQPRTIGVGVDKSNAGKFLTWAIPEYSVNATFRVLRDSASQTLQALRGTSVNHPWILQWGNGTADGTLKFTIQGALSGADSANDDVNSILFKLRGVNVSGGAAPLTVLLADGLDRGW